MKLKYSFLHHQGNKRFSLDDSGSKGMILCMLAVIFSVLSFNVSAQVCCPVFQLKDAVEICPPEGACQGGTAPGGNAHPMVACKLTNHQYTVYPNMPGYTYTWTITGGTPVSATGNPVNILWGNGTTGTIKVVISNLAMGGNCLDSLKQDICLIDGPQANFTVSNDTVCVGTPVIFTNTSAGGKEYLWDFGDGSYSNMATPPPHSYSAAGTYTVILTVYNSGGKSSQGGDMGRPCGCVDTIAKTIVVLNGAGPVINLDCCYGTVCPGDTTSLCSPPGCTTYNWSVTGGTIISGAGTNCIKVKWNAVYSGPTTVTLSTPGCLSSPCPGSTTIQVPVLYPNLPITGPNPLCVGSSGSYFLPHLPGTYYLWTTTAPPGTYSFNDVNRNSSQVNITFSVAGTYQIQCQYNNPMAGCSGTSVFTVDVLPVFMFTGDDVVCEGSAINYIANGTATWTVVPAAGATVPPGISANKTITWNIPGTYVLTATHNMPGSFCNPSATKVVEVVAKPVLGSIVGPNLVCPGKNFTYKITSNTQGSFFVWSVTAGGTVMTQMGADRDSAIIKLNGAGPWTVSVYQQIEIAPGVFCQSLTQTMLVNKYPAPVVSGPSTVCVDAITTFTASGTVPPGGIQWSVSPANRGTIMSGQGTASVNIRWHGTPTTATVIASHCGGTGTLPVTIVNPPSVGNITANGPTEYCLPSMPNNLILSVTGGFPSYQWSLNGSPISGATNSSYAIPNATFTGAGVYYFAVAVSNGSCTVTKTTYILIGNCSGGGGPPNPVVCTVDFSINPNPACQNQPVTFTALPTGPGFAFSWTFGDGSTSFQTPTDHAYALPGPYTVTLTATLGSCVATKTKTVNVNPTPVVSIVASDTIFCPGSSVTLTATSGMASYQWYRENSLIPGATNMTYNASQHGEYQVEATNAFTCSGRSNSIYIYMHGTPKADIDGETLICGYAGGFAALNLTAFYDPNYQYDWSSLPGGVTFTPNNSNASFQTVATLTLPMSLPANYNMILKVTDLTTNCTSFDTLCVWFHEYPNVTIPFYSGCEDSLVTLTPSPIDTSKYTYQWSNGAVTPTVTVWTAGFYSVTVTDKTTGCSTVAYGAMIYPKPDLSLFPIGCGTLLCGDTINLYIPLPLNAEPPYNNYPVSYPTITWYSNGNWGSPLGTGQTIPFVPATAGTHQISVVVTNHFGCSDTAGVYCLDVYCLTDDFGDAPDNPSGGFNYPTLLPNGARHTVSPNIFLGNLIDIETNGQPNIVASGDNIASLNDEDGVVLPSVIMIGSSVSITVTASASGFLDAWIDFNINGDWTAAGEHIFINQPVTTGPNTLTFTVPAGSSVGASYARFRYRTIPGPLSFNGPCANGEVEDYPVYIEECNQGNDLDFGDLPNNPEFGYNYPTLLPFNGARHLIYPNIRMGALIDPETNGQPNLPATGDDIATSDDEDGVTIVGKMYVGKPAVINVTASINGFLNAWMDFNKDGDLADPGEQIFTNQALLAGPNTLTFLVPTSALQGKTYSRFRFNTVGGVPYFGLVMDGEVEDYQLHMCPYWWPIPTPVKHTILIPNTLEDLTPGDVLGVFYTDAAGEEHCAGLAEWNGTDTKVLVAYGDNPNTPALDGFIVGQPIIWRLCSVIKGDADHVDVTYDPTYPNHTGVFAAGGFSSLTDVSGLHVSISADPTLVCPEDPVQLTADVMEGASGVTFAWTSSSGTFVSGEQNPVAYPLESTTYYLHATDGVFHDHDTVSVNVTGVSPLMEFLPLRNVTIPVNTFKCYNATIQISAAGNQSTFIVQNGGHADMLAGQKIILNPGTRVYSGGYLKARIVTNGQYCCSAGGPLMPEGATGLFDQPVSDEFYKVFPNPTTGEFTVQLLNVPEGSDVKIDVFDMLGGVIASTKVQGTDRHVFNLSDRAPGIYLVRVTSGERTGFGKVIKR